MSKVSKKAITAAKSSCNLVMRIGRAIGARRTLFVWSATSFAIAAFIVVPNAIAIYKSGLIVNLTFFMTGQIAAMVSLFLRFFAPMFLLVVAAKYIFDCPDRRAPKPSFTFKLSAYLSILIGLLVAVLYYLDGGNMIGAQTGSAVCAAGEVCRFSWALLYMAGRAFLATSVIMFLLFLGLRGIYDQLSFMLEKK